LFVLAPYIPLTNSRYLGGYQFIPIGIGAAIGIAVFSDWMYKTFRVNWKVTTIILIFLFGAYFSIGLWASWKEHDGYISANRWNIQVFVPDDTWEAITFLSTKKGDDVVVAPLDISTMIPAFTSHRTVSGHKTITYEYEKKNIDLAEFYGRASHLQAKEFLKIYNVRYAVQQFPDSVSDRWYEMLGMTKIYTNASVRTYSLP